MAHTDSSSISNHDEMLTIYKQLSYAHIFLKECRLKDNEILAYLSFMILKSMYNGSIEEALSVSKKDNRDSLSEIEQALAATTLDSIRQIECLIDSFPSSDPLYYDLKSFPRTYDPESFRAAFYEMIDFPHSFLGYVYSSGELLHNSSLQKDYFAFLNSLIGRNGGSAIDFNACFTLFNDYSSFDRYVIIAHDPVYRAFLFIKRAIDATGWENVYIIDELSRLNKQSFDYIFFLQRGKKGFGTHYPIPVLKDIHSRIQLSRHYSIVYTAGRSIKGVPSWLERLSEKKYPDIVFKDKDMGGETFVLSAGLTNNKEAVTYVDSYKAFPDSHLDYAFYSPECASAILKKDSRFVCDVAYKDLIPYCFDPSFYFYRALTIKEDTIPLRDVLTPAIMDFAEDGIEYSGGFEGLGFAHPISSKPPSLQKPHLSTQLYTTKGPAILVCNAYFGVGIAKDDAFAATFVDLDKNFCFTERCFPFTYDSSKMDPRYVVMSIDRITCPLFLSPLVKERDASIDAFLSLHIPYFPLEQQQQEVERYLRNQSDIFLNGLPIADNHIQILVMTDDESRFIDNYHDKIKSLKIKVLGYGNTPSSFKSIFNNHYGEDVISSNAADGVLVSADIPENDLVNVFLTTNNTGIKVFLFSETDTFDFDGFKNRWPGVLPKNVFYLKGTDVLEQVKNHILGNRIDIKEDVPELKGYIKAAERFDKQYPEWGLIQYTSDLYSKRKFELNLAKFRSKIAETICDFFKRNKVVPDDLDPGAVPFLIFSGSFKDSINNRKRLIEVDCSSITEDIKKKEEWIKASFIALWKIGCMEAHDSTVSDSTLAKATFLLFTEIIKWLDRDDIRARYQYDPERGPLYKITPLK